MTGNKSRQPYNHFKTRMIEQAHSKQQATIKEHSCMGTKASTTVVNDTRKIARAPKMWGTIIHSHAHNGCE